MKKTLLTLLILCLMASTNLYGKASASPKKGRKKGGKTELVKADSAKKKEFAYDKLFKKPHTITRGMIDLHKIEGKLYFELPVALFNREMLIGSTVTNISDNANAVVGSKPEAPLHVLFTRNDTHVQLRQVNSDYLTNNSRIDSALRNSTIGAILKNVKIAAYNRDSTAVVFEMTDFFVGDNKKMTPFDDNSIYGQYKRSESYQSNCSYLSGIKSFKDNVSIKSTLSYTFSVSDREGRSLIKDKPFTVEMTRSIMLLKPEAYRPRMADYRIGVFFTQRDRLGEDSHTTAPTFFANRWDLQPSDVEAYRRGELVKPIKPIVFYIDNTFPEEWMPYIMEGVNQWQEMFETIGFKEAIVAKKFPTDDPEFDPDNIKYSCIRYAPISIQNAMGPSWVDPRSGEILMASVYVYHDIIKLINNWLFVQTATVDPDVRAVKIPTKVTGDVFRYVISHEVGHCLGFMHNMSGSSVIPVDSLRSPSYTQKYGTTTSIMDYARFNYVAQPGDKERGVRLTPPRFGIYDKYLIAWTYRPIFDAKTLDQEYKITTQWITDSVKANPVYRYGKQQLYSVIDPRSQTEDLGDDAVKATKYGIQNLKLLTKNLNAWITKDDDDFEFRQSALIGIIEQLAMYSNHVAANVGGYYVTEVKSGDTQPRFSNIPIQRQKESLNYLIAMYGDLNWLDNKELLGKMSVAGSPKQILEGYIANRIIMAPFKVAAYQDVAGESYKYQDAANRVFKFIWGPTSSGSALDKSQMAIQKRYLYTLMSAINFPIPGSKTKGIVEDSMPLGLQKLESQTFNMSSLLAAEHNPVGGFEWMPLGRFRQSQLTAADVYNYIRRVEVLLRSRVAAATGQTQAHYRLLLTAIDMGVK